MGLLDKIRSRDAVVGVIGLGYVGLPLAVAFAESGMRVVGIDIDESRVRAVNEGRSYIGDVSAKRLAPLVTRDGAEPLLGATTSHDVLRTVDVAIICVPTPLNKTRTPEMSYIIRATEEVAEYLHSGMLVVLESTTYPGTTEEVLLPRLEEADGGRLALGEDFFLAFSPERIDPGQIDWTIRNTPKVVGGVTPRCTELASALYSAVAENVVRASSPMVAEMAKLLENTYRAVNIALVNEMAIMCERLGVDVWEVIDMSKTKPFGFATFYPGPGLGGHCIPSDPEYLAWKMKSLNYDARFIHLASEVNMGMPEHVLGLIADALNREGQAVKGSRILVLGVAYKAEVSDVRDSPALDVIQLLSDRGAEVTYNDPHVPSVVVGDLALSSAKLDQELVESVDCVAILTAHKDYDWQWVVDHGRLIVDTRNATEGTAVPSGRVVKLGGRA